MRQILLLTLILSLADPFPLVRSGVCLAEEGTVYACPDDLLFLEKPGNCPVCGRKLEPVTVTSICPVDKKPLKTFENICKDHPEFAQATGGIVLYECSKCGTKSFDSRSCPKCGKKRTKSDKSEMITFPYICLKHHHFFSNKPGKCPICGTELKQGAY